jgi:hypothetical protein
MTAWVKSSYSGTNEHSNCVEVALSSQATAVRDSKAPAAGHLTLPRASWAAFLTEVRE